MRVSKTIRKVAAIGAGATMLGATMFGAMAADLASYPKPFVQDGKYNALIVFGDTAKTSDVIGAVDIATNLAFQMKQTVAASGATSTTVEEGAAVETSGQKLYKADNLNTTKESFTKSDLPTLLAKQTITDTDGTSVDVTQTIKTIKKASVTFDKTPDNLDDPILNVALNDNTYNYSTQIDFSPAVDTLKLQSKKVTLFGKEYTFSTNTAELNASTDTGLVLYGGGVQKIMTAGDTATVDVEGKQAVVSVVGVNTDLSTAMVTCNGESKQMAVGATDTLGGIRIYVKQIFTYTVPAKQGAAELFIGTDKLAIKTGQAVKKGSSDVDGTKASVTATGTKVSSIIVTVTPNAGTPQVKYLKIGSSFADPVWAAFKWTFTGVTPPLEDASRDVIKVYPSSEDRLTLEFTNRNGQKYSAVVMNGTETSTDAEVCLSDGSYKIVNTNTVAAQGVINENEKFIIGTKEYTHIYQLKQISLSSSTPKIKVQDVAQGSTTEELTVTTGGTGNYGNYSILNLDGYSYTIYINSAGTAVNITSGLTNALYTKSGASITLPTSGGAAAACYSVTAANVTIAEETDYNDGLFRDAGANTLGGNIGLNVHMNTSSNYDMQVDSPAGIPSSQAISMQTVGTSYDRRAVTRYGTYIKYNTESDVVQMYYPGAAANYQVFVAPTIAIVKTTGEGGTSSVTINEIAVGAAKLASDALAADPDLSINNYILVGGPCVNAAAVKIMGADAAADCAAGFEAGKAKVKLYENAATGKVALLVAGYSAEDTTRAARAVKTGKLATVAAAAKEVSVTTVTDTPTLTVVTQ